MDTAINKTKPNISIIVPVYNVEKYLDRCLDSIYTQIFSGTFEVIAVEDASTDNSLKVLKSYQEKELGLKVIEHGTNKNLSRARATGIYQCKGDYIMHVDSDDWLLPSALEDLYAKCLETNADVLVFNYVRENNEGKRTSVKSIKNQISVTDKLKVQQHFLGAPWNKIIKSALAKNLISGQVGVNNGEDLIYATEILLRAKQICLLPGSYYAYFVNTESLTRKVNSEQFLKTMIIVLSQLNNIVSKYQSLKSFNSYLMNYFEKFIYLESANIHFSKNSSSNAINRTLIQEIFKSPLMSKNRIKRLNTALANKYICMYEVFKRFGIRTSLSIVVRGIKK
tara:strand:- start:617 stop:1630 length:1014 start_codon:yes stop_codon:yes gene_type:complete